jgi:hypothetical protein
MTERGTRLVSLAILLLLAAAVAVTAASRPVTAQFAPIQPGRTGLTIYTDQTQYTIGQPIQVCFYLPAPGQVIITRQLQDGRSLPVRSGFEPSATGCFNITAEGPVGTQCLVIIYGTAANPNAAANRTCYRVVGPTPVPPPVPPAASISTNKNVYQIGEVAYVCYRVPGPGQVTITDILADGRTQVFLQGFDDGTGSCVPGIVTPPTGTECMRLDYSTAVGSGSRQTCFLVQGSPWREVGSLVYAGGVWNFDRQASIAQDETFVRVTSGRCLDAPDRVIVFEGALQLQNPNGRLGVTTWVGTLTAAGAPATGTGGVGTARITRPVVPNPVSQVDAALYNLRGVPTGTNFTVCVRRP